MNSSLSCIQVSFPYKMVIKKNHHIYVCMYIWMYALSSNQLENNIITREFTLRPATFDV